MSEQTKGATLAERIVTALLTVHGSGDKVQTGTRLAIKQQQFGGPERDLGGRCFSAAVDTVEDALQGIANPEAVAGLVEALECSSRVIMQCPDAPYRDEQLAQNAAALAALEQEQGK